MKKIKHYSFDLWLTLIKSNPYFKKARAEYFFKNFNFLRKSIQEVETIFREVDVTCNRINEITGKNIDSDEMYLLALHKMNGKIDFISEIAPSEIYSDIEVIIFNYLPEIYDKNTLETLKKIKYESKDITMNILSNTAFIKGETLRKVLNELAFSEYFDFYIFSDEVGYSKPNIKIFNLAWDEILKIRNDSTTLKKEEVIHIGDNFSADIEGAEKFGFSYLQINSNEKSITQLLEYAA